MTLRGKCPRHQGSEERVGPSCDPVRRVPLHLILILPVIKGITTAEGWGYTTPPLILSTLCTQAVGSFRNGPIWCYNSCVSGSGPEPDFKLPGGGNAVPTVTVLAPSRCSAVGVTVRDPMIRRRAGCRRRPAARKPAPKRSLGGPPPSGRTSPTLPVCLYSLRRIL
eukprot:767012-Hanusia_phi.AAC.3